MIVATVSSVAVLVALCALSGGLGDRVGGGGRRRAVWQGGLFGLAAVAGMWMPVASVEGLIVDGRAMVLGLGAWYFGPWAALASAGLAAAGRIALGGAGAPAGVALVGVAVLVGLAFRWWRPPGAGRTPPWILLGIGLSNQLVMLGLLEAMTRGSGVAGSLLNELWAPTLLVFPIATVLAGWILDDQRLAREALLGLRREEGRLRAMVREHTAMLHAAMDGFWVVDGQGRILEVNDRYCEVLGYAREEVLAMRVTDLDPDFDEGTYREQHREVLRLGEARFERRHRRKDGRFIQVEVSASRLGDEAGDEGRVCAFFNDITEQREREEQMRLQSAALAAADNTVFITDSRGRIVWANSAFTRHTGYTSGEVQGRTPGEILKSGRHPETFYREMWDTIRKGNVWRGEFLNRDKEGRVRPELTTITPLFGPSGVISHYIAIKQDLSELKEMERMLLRAQRLENIGTLASGIAHDLNNILAPIVMSGELLRQELPPGQLRELAEIVAASSKRGAGVIRQLLAFARGSEGERREIQLRHLLHEDLRIHREMFPKNLHILEHLERDLWTVCADPTQVHQVLLNLMVNARDAMPEGGEMAVEAGNVTLTPEWAEAHPPARAGRFVRLVVRDQGTGIPEKLMDRIFEPFLTTKAPGKGTGLGLSTVRGIVRGHGGFILCRNRPEGGAEFEVYLPALEGEGLEDALPVEVPLPGAEEGEIVLVVDDEEAVRHMLLGTLGMLGYRIEFARDGAEALARLAQAPSPDLVLLDWVMPGLDGGKVLESLDARGDCRPVLVMSGMFPEGNRVRERLRGRPFLLKPFTVEQLARSVRGILDQQLEKKTENTF